MAAMALGNDAVAYIQKMGGGMTAFERSYFEEEPEQELGKDLLIDLAETGEEGAQYQYAANLLFGEPELGIERNVPQAVEIFEDLAQNNNNIGARDALGVVYSQGIGVEQNTTKALEHLEASAEQGSASAYNTLGFMYNHGIGVEPDQQLAIEYMEQAAELGHIEATNNLGILYLNGEGVKQDNRKALEYLEIAADEGYITSKFYLGVLNLHGIGTGRNCTKAIDLFRTVFENGELSVYMRNAHSFYTVGDYEGAYLNYALASTLGFENGFLNAAYMFQKGQVPYT